MNPNALAAPHLTDTLTASMRILTHAEYGIAKTSKVCASEHSPVPAGVARGDVCDRVDANCHDIGESFAPSMFIQQRCVQLLCRWNNEHMDTVITSSMRISDG